MLSRYAVRAWLAAARVAAFCAARELGVKQRFSRCEPFQEVILDHWVDEPVGKALPGAQGLANFGTADRCYCAAAIRRLVAFCVGIVADSVEEQRRDPDIPDGIEHAAVCI